MSLIELMLLPLVAFAKRLVTVVGFIPTLKFITVALESLWIKPLQKKVDRLPDGHPRKASYEAQLVEWISVESNLITGLKEALDI